MMTRALNAAARDVQFMEAARVCLRAPLKAPHFKEHLL